MGRHEPELIALVRSLTVKPTPGPHYPVTIRLNGDGDVRVPVDNVRDIPPPSVHRSNMLSDTGQAQRDEMVAGMRTSHQRLLRKYGHLRGTVSLKSKIRQRLTHH